MKLKITYTLIGLVILLSGCKNNTSDESQNEQIDNDKFIERLHIIEDSLNTGMPSKETIRKAVTAFQDFAVIFPEDEKASEYLFKASDLALNIGQPEKSVKILNRIIKDYPNYKRIESVYYSRASHTDFELRDTTLAKTYYNEFMEKFPHSDFVDDAQARFKFHFMDENELIEYFMSHPQTSDEVTTVNK